MQNSSSGTGAGDPNAFGALARRHVDWIYSSARRRVGDAHLAEDIAQAVFIALAQKPPRWNSPSLSPWLFGVLIRTCNTALKRQATRQRHESEAAKMRASIDPHSASAAEWSDSRRTWKNSSGSSVPATGKSFCSGFMNKRTSPKSAESSASAKKPQGNASPERRTSCEPCWTAKASPCPPPRWPGVLLSHVTSPAPAALAGAISAAPLAASATGSVAALAQRSDGDDGLDQDQGVGRRWAFCASYWALLGIIAMGQRSSSVRPALSAAASQPSAAATAPSVAIADAQDAQVPPDMSAIRNAINARLVTLQNVSAVFETKHFYDVSGRLKATPVPPEVHVDAAGNVLTRRRLTEVDNFRRKAPFHTYMVWKSGHHQKSTSSTIPDPMRSRRPNAWS